MAPSLLSIVQCFVASTRDLERNAGDRAYVRNGGE
jgi:hypothetical protein